MHSLITFKRDGSACGLYTELIPLNEIGKLEVSRASTIEFNNSSQHWEVKNRKGRVLYFHRHRGPCLAWEHQHFNR